MQELILLQCPDQNNLPVMKYSFVPIDKLTELQENQICGMLRVFEDFSVTHLTS